MDTPIKLMVISLITAGCSNTPTKEEVKVIKIDSVVKTEVAIDDTTPKVTGIGGIFFFSDDPNKTKEWYSTNLGIATDEYGAPFEFRNANRPEEINYLEWAPFKTGAKYFAPSKKDFMINYRVQNMEGLLRKLRTNGVTILDSVAEYDYGKFVHIMDAEGNKIELWEPIDSILTKVGSKTTK